MNITREFIEERTILCGLVGSTVWGLNVSDGIDDRDEMGVCVEPIEVGMGLEPFEQFTYRSAAEREGNHNAKSGAGDLDLVIYSLRKYVRLALKGNPTILSLLFVPKEHLVVTTPVGDELRTLAPFFVSKRSGTSCLGYLRAQRERLNGDRGQMRSNRPELIEKYGFNTKYAMHMLRLGYQGIELMTTGKMTMPMVSPIREELLALRQGQMSKEDALARAADLETELCSLIDDRLTIQSEPATQQVENWMIDTYRYSFIRDV